jgi:N-methylhydantoinase A
VRTFLRPLAGLEPRDLVEALASLEGEAESLLSAQGYGAERVEIERSADLKYQGQSFELSVPLGPSAIGIDGLSRLAEAFDKEHERTYGHKAEGDPIQIVNLRLTARVRRATDLRRETRFIPGARARGGEREAYFGPGHGVIRTRITPVIGREDLDERPRHGPLLIDEYDATTLVPPDCPAHLDAHGNIVIDTGA